MGVDYPAFHRRSSTRIPRMFSIARAVPALLAALGAASFSGLIAAQLPATAKPPAPPAPAAAQPAAREGLVPASARRSDEGRGPFKTLVIRGVTLIDGTGAPPQGPMDIVVSGNRIASIRSAGTPGLAAAAEPGAAERRPRGRRDRDVPDARLRRPARARRRRAEERRGRVRLQALARARRDDRARRPARRQRVHASARRSAARRTRSPRRGSTTISVPGAAGTRAASRRRRAAREYVRWAPPTASTA